jgi:hypothetical protein
MADTERSAPSPATAQLRPKVIYVMGAGRSGSTIFGVTLGNCAGVFYAGELDAWLVRRGVPQLEDPQRLRFWSEVRAQVPGAEALFGNVAQRSIERSLAILRVHKWPTRRRLRAPYSRVSESLYRAIAAQARVTHIVDTSHYPLRAREMQRIAGIDLYLVYLVRDPQSVVASFNRRDVAQYSKSTLSTNVYLWLTNVIALYVFLRQPRQRRLLVRYEDLIADPEAMLRDILRRVDCGSEPPDLGSLRTGLPFQGNRLIRTDVISLERDTRPPRRTSRVTAWLQLPLSSLLMRLRPRASAMAVDRARPES